MLISVVSFFVLIEKSISFVTRVLYSYFWKNQNFFLFCLKMLWVYPIQGYIFIIYNICINIIFIYIYIYMFFLAVYKENTSSLYPWGGFTHNIFISFQNILLYENEKILFFQKFSPLFFFCSYLPPFFSFVV